MSVARRIASVLVALSLAAASARAQVIRGRVLETTTGVPVAGAVVSLERTSGAPFPDQAAYSVLSSDSGTYVLRAPAPGSYRVTAKRIGVKRTVSPDFELAAGETKQIDLRLEAVVLELPEVVVSRLGLCVTHPNEAARVAALWDEATTLLTATRIAMRDTLFAASIVRYTRSLQPQTLRVLHEVRRSGEGLFDRPFQSLSGDSLSAIGYWTTAGVDTRKLTTDTRNLGADTTVFYGLDAQVLTSPAFVRDHCFNVVDANAEHAGMTGLGFEPSPDRTLPDVKGTLWLDAKSFELRSVDFEYTQLMSEHGADHFGGVIYFARLPNGIWIVRRWYLRMPQYLRSMMTSHGLEVMPLPRLTGVVEEGGQVSAAGMTVFEKPASATGTLADSSGARVRNGVVKLAGTSYETRTDDQGRFRLDSLPPGAFDLVYDDSGYTRFGIAAADEEVSLDEGTSRTVNLRADRMDGVATRLCLGHKPVKQHGTLRLTVLDTATAEPLRGLRLRLSWSGYGKPQHGMPTVINEEVFGKTDAQGVTVFCELPAKTPLSVTIPLDDEHGLRVASLMVRDGEVATRVVRVRY